MFGLVWVTFGWPHNYQYILLLVHDPVEINVFMSKPDPLPCYFQEVSGGLVGASNLTPVKLTSGDGRFELVLVGLA